MPEFVHLAFVRRQWIQIDEKDSTYYLHTRKLKIPSSEEMSASEPQDKFSEHLEKWRNRGASPLKHEYDPEANKTWRWMEVDGHYQWVKKDWSQEPPRKLWAFDSDGDDETLAGIQVRRAAEEVGYGATCGDGREAVTEQATVDLLNSVWERSEASSPRFDETNASSTEACHEEDTIDTIDTFPQVCFGEGTIHQLPAYADSDQRPVSYGEDTYLDDEESEDRAQYLRLGRLATIESSKETRSRRKSLNPLSDHHNCSSCIDREGSTKGQPKRKVSFGVTTIVEIPEEFVTTLDEAEERGELGIIPRTSGAQEEREESFITRSDISELGEQPLDIKSDPKTFAEPGNRLVRRTATVKFAPVTVIKESPASHLPILKRFPDSCVASKPIFRPNHRRGTAEPRGPDQTRPMCETPDKTNITTTRESRNPEMALPKNRSADLTSSPDVVEQLRPFTRADLQRLRKRDSRYASKEHCPLRKEIPRDEATEEVEETVDDEVKAVSSWSHALWRWSQAVILGVGQLQSCDD
jgi:hypothetical protein